MGLDTASTPISWDEAAAWIRDGSTQQLARLQRSEQGLKQYNDFKQQVTLEWASILDYLLSQLYECTITLNQEGKKCAAVSDHILQQPEPVLQWRENDFPYNFTPGIKHHVLWSTRPLDAAATQRFIQDQLPDQDILSWVNPPELQSIRALWHCHVLSRASNLE